MKYCHTSLIRIVMIAALFSASLTACDQWKKNEKADKAHNNTSGFVQEAPKEQSSEPVRMLLPDFTGLVESVGPSVVNIQASRESAQKEKETPSILRDPFFELFKQFIPEFPEETDSVSFGSGFIISSDGYVITNAHVVKNRMTFKVSLTDKREFNARLIGMDEASDTALLKIDAKNLPAVKIGNPQDLKVGEWVAAIGAPFGFDNTVTAGIVSAKNRSLPNENYTAFIQTDVAINPGNSGGPLFNLKGEVVGVNSQIYSRSGGFMGISFAVPIDIAINVAEQLKTDGKVQRSQLGVIIQEVSYDLGRSFGLERPEGALVVRVLENGPAEDAKIKIGDIIQKVDDVPVHSSSDLPLIIGSKKPGTTIQLTIWRDKKSIPVEVTLSALGDNTSLPLKRNKIKTPSHQEEHIQVPELDVTVTPIPEATAKHHGLTGGLLVLEARKKSADLGLSRGDIIVSIGDTPVNDAVSLQAALAQYKDTAPVYIIHNGQFLFLPIPLKR